MTIYLWIMFVVGALEIASNSFHLSRGSISAIARSAKWQHGEIPPDLSDDHYLAKAVVMLVFGLAFLTCSGATLWLGTSTYVILAAAAAFALYGLIQVLMYPRFLNVWPSAVVYAIPFVAGMLLM